MELLEPLLTGLRFKRSAAMERLERFERVNCSDHDHVFKNTRATVSCLFALNQVHTLVRPGASLSPLPPLQNSLQPVKPGP